ncbi:hypothetical protein MRX96_025214 [Rhipicephalus microplus]
MAEQSSAYGAESGRQHPKLDLTSSQRLLPDLTIRRHLLSLRPLPSSLRHLPSSLRHLPSSLRHLPSSLRPLLLRRRRLQRRHLRKNRCSVSSQNYE